MTRLNPERAVARTKLFTLKRSFNLKFQRLQRLWPLVREGDNPIITEQYYLLRGQADNLLTQIRLLEQETARYRESRSMKPLPEFQVDMSWET